MILMPGSAAVPHLARTPYVPGSTMPMFDEPLSPQAEGGTVWRNMSVRQLITPLTNSGRQFRFTLYKNGAGFSVLPIKNVSFEIQDNATNDFKTAQQPKEILFGGVSGVPAGSTGEGPGSHGTVVSDWMELWHSIGPLNKMIVICDMGTGSDYAALSLTAAQYTPNEALYANLKAWYRSGASYNLAVPTGTWNVNNYWLGPIKKIEVR
jgi:hypothetical protein